ncbi:MAG: glycosyltransferase family 39 protein [Clostridia bacterium]|nr:glycosyltransferase family 39 protein [Clostridia bacterium]
MNSVIVISLLYLALFALVFFSGILGKEDALKLKRATGFQEYRPYLFGLFVVFLMELALAAVLPGHVQDMGLFRAWAAFGENHSMSEYYTADLYVDYPPVYLMVLYALGRFGSLLGLSSDSVFYTLLVKSVPIVCDIVFAGLILVIANRQFGIKKAGILTLLCALNPATIVNSAVWGQADSFVLLITLGMLFSLYNKQYLWSAGLFALSLLTKPQMIIFAPLLGFTMLSDLAECFLGRQKRKQMLLNLAGAACVALLVFFIVPLPVVGLRFDLLLARYVSGVGLYPYATLNAANFYGALGLNWADISMEYLFFNIAGWGYFFIIVMSVLVGVASFLVKDRKKIFYLAAFIVSTVYLFSHMMHERYLYALMPMLLLLFIFTKEKKMLLLYGGFSVTYFINVAWVLILNHQEEFIYGDNLWFILLSALQLVLYGCLVYYGAKALFRKGAKEQVSKNELQAKDNERIVKWDILCMAALMLLYSFFAFWNLGSFDVPDRGWYAQEQGEVLTFDFGEVKPIRQIYSYTGWIDRRESDQEVRRNIILQTSEDGSNWTELEEFILLDNVWRYVVTDLETSARYLRIVPDEPDFYINEMAFFGESEAERYLPMETVSSVENPTALFLFDEQESLKYEFSWYDETYFDEIYHPRTAYEHLTVREPYENTHPPLGKLIISVGISMFGMNPFGWRFMGTLCGMLMIPFAYLLGKRLFHQRFFAFVAAFLFTFDFMHLSQTRLATIDSYTTFFVMGMYYFMYRYMTKSFYRDSLKETLIPLFWSGLFFGLGIATKWQGAYAGVGLAFLFFYTLAKRYSEFRIASAKKRKDEEEREIVEKFPKMAIHTVCWAGVFFVVIPVIIYFVSYLPAMLVPGLGVPYAFAIQSAMLSYHGGLSAAHPFGSPWWSWPLDAQPLYAYGPNRRFVAEGTSMAISSFGNPLIWWLTIPAICAAIVRTIRRKGSPELTFILTGFLAMYLPWVLIPRVAFIYHFFPCVMFVVLAIVYFIKEWLEKRPQDKKYVYIYLALVLLLFIAFYPTLTGMAVPTAYVEGFLEWLPGWVILGS